MREFLFITISLQLLAGLKSQKLPDDIKKCHYGNTTCIKDSINGIIRRYPKGISEIGIKPIDAVDVKNCLLVNDPPTGVAWFRFNLLNQVIYGFENTTITNIKGFGKDPTASKMEIQGTVPSLIYKGEYTADGRIMWFVGMESKGESVSDFQNFRFTLQLKVITEYRNNKRYLKIYELVPVVTLDRWILWLDKFFPENTDLTIAVNTLFNANWLEFWNELEPEILEIFSSIFSSLINDIFNKVSYDDMFLSD